MNSKSFKPGHGSTHSLTSGSTGRSQATAHSKSRIPASRRKNENAKREAKVRGHLKADDLAATGKSLYVPVYKPSQAIASLAKSNVYQKLLSNHLHQTKPNELEIHPLHVKCSCGNLKIRTPNMIRASRSTSSSPSCSSSGDSEDDEESNDEDGMGYDIADLIKLLIVHENKGRQQRSGTILRNLAMSVTINEDTTEVQLHQLLRLVSSQVACVREASLLTLEQAGRLLNLAKLLLDSGALGRVLMLLRGEDEGKVIVAGCQFLGEITQHQDLKDLWLEEMIVTGLTVLIGLLSCEGRGQCTSSVQSQQAAACLLSQLANHLQLGIMMLDHGMDDIEVAFKKQAAIREPITELLTNLIRHNDHTAGGVLNHKFTSLVAVALRDGPCCIQIKAMDFCRELCKYDAGVQALIKDTMLFTTCLQILKSTNCRYVRRLGTSNLDALLRGSNTKQLQILFHQADKAFKEKNQVLIDPNRRRAKDVWIPLTKQVFDEMEGGGGDRKETGEEEEMKRMRSGVKEIVDLVVQVICVAGKIQRDEKNSVTDVRYRPVHDDLSGLQEAVNCLKTLANMSEAIMDQLSVHRLLLSCGSLCVIDILHTFTAAACGSTSCTTPDTTKQQRNPEALYLQASMKLWQGSAKRADSGRDVRDLFEEDSLSFVRLILKFLQVLAESSCNRWSKGIVGQLEKQVMESCGWQDDNSCDDDGTRNTAPYKYVESVGHVFHDRGTLNRNGVKERRSKVRFAWDENDEGTNGTPAHQTRPFISNSRIQSHSVGSRDGANSNNNNNNMRSKENKWASSRKGNVYRHDDGSGEDLEITQRRQKGQLAIKKALVRCGLCETVSSWMNCGLDQIEEVACNVMQCIIQPQDPEEIHRYAAEASTQLNPAQRHQARAQEMADSLAQRDALLTKIISQMSMETADLVSDTIQVKGHSHADGQEKVKGDNKIKRSRANHKSDDGASGSTTSSSTTSKLRNKQTVSSYKPTVKSDKPLAYQTSLAVLDLSGKRLVKSLVMESPQASSNDRRRQLLVLYDLVGNGDVVIHMTLASYGLLSYLMQYVQRNVQYSVDVLLCLTILRNMMGDHRIKQLFRSEGGEKFLQRVVTATKGAVKLHAERFLSFLSQGIYLI